MLSVIPLCFRWLCARVYHAIGLSKTPTAVLFLERSRSSLASIIDLSQWLNTFFQVEEVKEEVGKQVKEVLVEVKQTEKEVAVSGNSKVSMTVASFRVES